MDTQNHPPLKTASFILQHQSWTLLCEALGVAPAHVDAVLHSRWSAVAPLTLGQVVSNVLSGQMVIPGVGRAGLRRLQASLALSEAMAAEELCARDPVSSPEACERWLRLHLGRAERECFCCLFLNAANAVIAIEDLFWGTVDGAVVYPRVVVQRALAVGACSVIAAHNHPSGRLEPSVADLRITERLKAALALVDIRLLDHMIVGGGRCQSLASLGHC